MKPDTLVAGAASREVHALDIGCGSGVLSVLAARHGADSVVAVDLMGPCADVALRLAAQNRVSGRVSVVRKDAGLLHRSEDVRAGGVNLLLLDAFDAGLVGGNAAGVLELARRQVAQPGATVVPAGATVYCMGVEVLSGEVAGAPPRGPRAAAEGRRPDQPPP